jgi:hypothetical protein
LVKNVSIRGNRDGIDVDSCKGVKIDTCTIDTGDDSISIKSGRGMDGARIGKPTEDVLITGCTLTGRNFACVGIGSETSGGVKNVKIEHCKLSASSQGVYVKTRIGRAGTIENITGDDIDILKGGFLRINLISSGNTNTNDDPVEGLLGYPLGRKFSFTNVRLNNATVVADVTGIAAEKPLEGLSLSNITGTATGGIKMANVKGAELKDIKVTGVNGDLVAIDNVTGTGLDGAGKLPAARGGAAGGARGPGRGAGGAGGGAIGGRGARGAAPGGAAPGGATPPTP